MVEALNQEQASDMKIGKVLFGDLTMTEVRKDGDSSIVTMLAKEELKLPQGMKPPISVTLHSEN